MATVYVGLGSNLGDRRAHLTRAVHALRGLPDTHVRQVSTMRDFPPVGGPPQPPYLNAVVALSTTLTPHQLLEYCHALEAAAGRVRPDPVRWGPRPLDLDLLLYDDLVVSDPALTLPHPRLAERLFVLEPLTEIAPDVRHPVLQMTVAELLTHLRSPSGACRTPASGRPRPGPTSGEWPFSMRRNLWRCQPGDGLPADVGRQWPLPRGVAGP